MKYRLIFACVVLFFLRVPASPLLKQEFDKDVFYTVMASGDLAKINTELSVVRETSFPERDAYEGALLMRKSGLLKKPEEKLKAFKAGRIHFETALGNDGDNPEYHFLRLSIQEHAPRVVKYYKDQEQDKNIVLKAFKNLSPVIQKAIREYSKTSQVLRPEDL